MKLIDELKILDDKIKTNQAQNDLNREAAKTFVLSPKSLDMYEYLTGEDLGYKPGPIEIKQAEYSPLAQIITKVVKKDDKVKQTVKNDNNLRYSSLLNFNIYSVTNFNEISSTDSKFDILHRFYKDFEKLKGVKSETEETRQRKIKVLNNTSML